MANNSTDIRRLMALVESVQEPVLLEGWLENLRNKRIERLGTKERQELANRLKGEWLKWLGQTDRTGDRSDMERFMRVRIGFKDKDIEYILGNAFYDDSEDDQNSDTDNTKTDDSKTDDQEKASEPDSVDDEKSDGEKEPGEVVDDPEKYRLPNGDWDRIKIMDKLRTMPVGDKLTLGTRSFSRSIKDPKTESIVESIVEAAGEDGALDQETVDFIMNMSAAQINDEYLLNGPVNDTNDALADLAAQKDLRRYSGRGQDGRDRGKMPSGQYDAQEMTNILKNDLDVGPAKLNKITQYVKANADKGYSRMQQADIDVLARIGYALLRART